MVCAVTRGQAQKLRKTRDGSRAWARKTRACGSKGQGRVGGLESQKKGKGKNPRTPATGIVPDLALLLRLQGPSRFARFLGNERRAEMKARGGGKAKMQGSPRAGPTKKKPDRVVGFGLPVVFFALCFACLGNGQGRCGRSHVR